MWQLWAICYSCLVQNNITLAKPEGRYAHAWMPPLFSAAVFFFGLVPLCRFFRFSCYLIEFCCPPVCSCLHFRLRGKPIWSVWYYLFALSRSSLSCSSSLTYFWIWSLCAVTCASSSSSSAVFLWLDLCKASSFSCVSINTAHKQLQRQIPKHLF